MNLKTITPHIDRLLNSPKVLSTVSLIPFNSKLKNLILNKQEAIQHLPICKSYPYTATLNLTNLCNLRCSFCEISYYYKKFNPVYPNTLSFDDFKKFSFIQHLYHLSFYGSVGEPLLNPDFIPIINYIKDNYKTRLFLNTNGQLLSSNISDSLIHTNFDDILISLHASNSETYKKLIGSDFDKLISYINYLISKKQSKPLVGIAFSLNKTNWHNYTDIIDLASLYNLNYIQVSHNYAVGNSNNPIDNSFFDDPDRGNIIITSMYKRAKIMGVNIIPKTPPLINKNPIPIITSNCHMPWNNIKFDGCLDYPDSYYVSVCNRISLFRLNYKEFNFNNFFEMWNHPILQYLRKYKSNPICSFCKDPKIFMIRNTDHTLYCNLRDASARALFRQCYSYTGNYPVIKGLYPLLDNPCR